MCPCSFKQWPPSDETKSNPPPPGRTDALAKARSAVAHLVSLLAKGDDQGAYREARVAEKEPCSASRFAPGGDLSLGDPHGARQPARAPCSTRGLGSLP
jgi:hypothetical protein